MRKRKGNNHNKRKNKNDKQTNKDQGQNQNSISTSTAISSNSTYTVHNPVNPLEHISIPKTTPQQSQATIPSQSESESGSKSNQSDTDLHLSPSDTPPSEISEDSFFADESTPLQPTTSWQPSSSSILASIVYSSPWPLDELLRFILSILHQVYIELANMLLEMFGWFGAGESSKALLGKQERIQMGEKKVKRRRRKIEQNGNGGDHMFKASNDHFPGMVNLSGTLCYMNSVLQAFASITSLVNHLEKIVELAVESDTPTPVTDALLEVIQDLNTPHSRSPPALRPHNLLQALHPLPQIRRLLSTREQQDAHELFVVLAEAISDEALKVAGEIGRLRGLGDILSLQRYTNSKNESTISGRADIEGANKRRKIRGIAQPWEGLVARRRVCQKCGWETEVRMDLVGGMELPIPLHGDVTLDSCIAEYLSPEYLSDVTCEACSLRSTLSHYQFEVDRLSSAPNSTKPSSSINGKANNSPSKSGSGSFAALEGLSTLSSTKEERMTNSRKKRCREAKRVENRLKEMLDSDVISNFNEPFLEPLHPQLDGEGSGSIPIKWQISRTQSIRQSILTRPPRSLRMLFIRSEFTPYGSVLKKTARVNFPIILDLTKFISNGIWEENKTSGSAILSNGIADPNIDRQRVLYRLESVILHYGYTHSSGHYICIRRKPTPTQTDNGDASSGSRSYTPSRAYKSCPDSCRCESCVYFGKVREGLEEKVPGKGWLRISDADVEEVGEEALYESRGAVFMLFYERVGEYRGDKIDAKKDRVKEEEEEQKDLNEASQVI